MATVKAFEDLEIWKLARVQTREFWEIANNTPLYKDFELKNQMNKSSGSVMDCIAEGFERGGNSEFKNFLIISRGSNAEYCSQLTRCFDRAYIDKQAFESYVEKNKTIAKKVMAFISYLQSSNLKGPSRTPSSSKTPPGT
jgi:four helix bundle protein